MVRVNSAHSAIYMRVLFSVRRVPRLSSLMTTHISIGVSPKSAGSDSFCPTLIQNIALLLTDLQDVFCSINISIFRMATLNTLKLCLGFSALSWNMTAFWTPLTGMFRINFNHLRVHLPQPMEESLVGEFRKNKPWDITEYDIKGNITGKYLKGEWIKN